MLMQSGRVCSKCTNVDCATRNKARPPLHFRIAFQRTAVECFQTVSLSSERKVPDCRVTPHGGLEEDDLAALHLWILQRDPTLGAFPHRISRGQLHRAHQWRGQDDQEGHVAYFMMVSMDRMVKRDMLLITVRMVTMVRTIKRDLFYFIIKLHKQTWIQ